MATIATKNEYESAVARLERLNQATDPDTGVLTRALGEVNQWKTIQDTQVVLGGMGRMSYRHYQHDEDPLVIYFNPLIRDLKAVAGLNLHYLSTRNMMLVVEWILRANNPRLSRGQAPALIWDIVKHLPIKAIPYRIYRLDGVAPFEYIPVAQWEEIARTERSRWQGHFDRDDV
jgi:hypothetical protein